ncbi:MAG TPA: hypothetical protein VFG49_08650, partial [Dyella sp.]|nr:hypothetical protein [Dyella sp.]
MRHEQDKARRCNVELHLHQRLAIKVIAAASGACGRLADGRHEFGIRAADNGCARDQTTLCVQQDEFAGMIEVTARKLAILKAKQGSELSCVLRTDACKRPG